MNISPPWGKWGNTPDLKVYQLTIYGTAVLYPGGQRWQEGSPLKYREDSTVTQGSKGRWLGHSNCKNYPSSSPPSKAQSSGWDHGTALPSSLPLQPRSCRARWHLGSWPLHKSSQTVHPPCEKHRMLLAGVGYKNYHSSLLALKSSHRLKIYSMCRKEVKSKSKISPVDVVHSCCVVWHFNTAAGSWSTWGRSWALGNVTPCASSTQCVTGSSW